MYHSNACGCSGYHSLEQKVAGNYSRFDAINSLPNMSSYSGLGMMENIISESMISPSMNYSKSQSSMQYASQSFSPQNKYSGTLLPNIGKGPSSSYSDHNSITYNPKSYSSYTSLSNNDSKFNPDHFLAPDRPATQFIGSSAEIQPLIEEAFKKTTGMFFPNDISVKVCSKEEFMKMGVWQEGLNGFCMNRKGFSFSQVFVLEGSLDRVMLTMGHEIGHCLSIPLSNKVDEEAKAFSFSMAFAKAIRDNDIGNLRMNVAQDPAKNGLHDIAFDFVLKLIRTGKDTLDIYKDLVKRLITSKNTFTPEFA
jgi:hypothetical protein